MQQYKQNKKKSYADTVKTPPKAQKGRPNNNPPKPPPTQKPTRPSQSFQPRFKNNPTIDPAVKKQLDQIKSDMDLIKKNSEQTDALVSKFNNYIKRAVKRRQRKEKAQKEKEMNLDQPSKIKAIRTNVLDHLLQLNPQKQRQVTADTYLKKMLMI